MIIILGGVFLKFIFPQNYCFNQKLFGFIDYSTLFLNGFWALLVYLISCIFSTNFIFQIAVFIILFFPVLLLSIIGFNHEKITYILKYLYFFIKSPKYYLYRKINL